MQIDVHGRQDVSTGYKVANVTRVISMSPVVAAQILYNTMSPAPWMNCRSMYARQRLPRMSCPTPPRSRGNWYDCTCMS